MQDITIDGINWHENIPDDVVNYMRSLELGYMAAMRQSMNIE